MFEKASSRTRISFYLAIKQLGGGTITIKANELQSIAIDNNRLQLMAFE